jgi:hypothetical protein
MTNQNAPLFRHSLNAANQFEVEHLIKSLMDPYAKPKERKVGAHRPKIRHVPQTTEPRTRRERQAEKETVTAQRRAIKKAARRHLKQQLLSQLEENE